MSIFGISLVISSDTGSCSTAVLNVIENELWVDRYRPSKFTDLLGDERVHRETMSWLKEWDYCVFGKRKTLHRPKPNDVSENVRECQWWGKQL